MRTRRVLQILTAIGSIVLLLIVLAMAVSALARPMGALAVLLATLAALAASRVVGRRIGRGTVLELDLDRGVTEEPPTALPDRLLNRSAVVLRDVTDALARAGADRRVVGLVARVGNGGLSVAQAQELRQALREFREAGKRAVAFSESFGESSLAIADYYLAAAFDEIHLIPTGSVSVQGAITRTPFLRGALDRLGIVPDIDHRREYKAMKYRFTEHRFVAPHEEAARAILDDHMAQIVPAVAEDRGLREDDARAIIDRAPLYGDEALAAGLVDRIGHRDGAYEAAKGDRGRRFMFLDQYLRRAGRPHRRGKRIALIYGTGSIRRGTSGFDPLTRGSSFGADDVARAFREARADKRVRAIVFRVDSPGGSAVASEVIHREVQRAREEGKPVVVSMGTVAGSGGYFVAAPADRIVAQPGTLTGSIGVVSGKLATGQAWRRIGVNWEELQVGKNATFSSPNAAYTESERERLEAGLDIVYEAFKARVAEGRSMAPGAVEEVARGRVWTGSRAAEIGLVDHLGGLNRAIEVARELAGIAAEAPISVVVLPKEGPVPIRPSKPSSEPVRDLIALIAAMRVGAPLEMTMAEQPPC